MNMTIQILQPSGKPESDVIIPLLEADDLSPVLTGIAKVAGINKVLLEKDFSGKAGQVSTLYPATDTTHRWHLVGIGKTADYRSVCKAFRLLAHQLRQQLNPQLAIDFAHSNFPKSDNSRNSITAAINGLLLGTYQIGLYKAEQKEHPLSNASAQLSIIADASEASCSAAAQRGVHIAKTQLRIYDLVNAPGNKSTPQALAQWAVESAEAHGYSTQVMDKQQIEETGLHALLAVNRGSEYPPAFIVMEYIPEHNTPDELPFIGLVGKGVTFDTGGLSIKGATNMHFMKSDMGGAAAVLGAMELASRLQLPTRLVGIVPTTDNCVDARSVKPGDVIDSYSGKSIEIIDTDAEGRLILADGLAYMQRHFKPDVLIDLATLTGSSVRTFGYQCAALFTDNDGLAKDLKEVGQACGERVWQLPMWDDYKKDLHSDIADVKNFSGRPVAGAISAAKFLEVFTDKHPAWAHLDIAGVAFGSSEFSKQRSATAFGVLLLTEFIEHYSAKSKN